MINELGFVLVKMWPLPPSMTALGHFQSNKPALPAYPCPLRTESDEVLRGREMTQWGHDPSRKTSAPAATRA